MNKIIGQTIVGLSAKIGCGKSTVAEKMKGMILGAKIFSYGDALKEECAQLFKFPLHWAYNQDRKLEKIFIGLGYKIAIYNADKGSKYYIPAPKHTMTVREILQWYGTDVVRVHDPDRWIRITTEKIRASHCKVAIIDDCRFPDEIDRCNIKFRIDPYPGWKPGEFADHESETALDDYQDFDIWFTPDFGELEDVARTMVWATIKHREEL